MPERKYREGDTVDVPGYGKGVMVGRPSAEGRIRVRLEDGTIVGFGGKYGVDPKIRDAVDQVLAARGIVREPGFAGYAAVGPGDNNAGDPLFNGPRDQSLKEQPLDEDVDPWRRTPEEVAEELVDETGTREQKEALRRQEEGSKPLAESPPKTLDKAKRGPRD